ncbi:hypothetical protein F5887DRAFT_1078200 [Amanita rubescens]|nr:hypothetical protein F5887DRAFT_1086762 [Amanita rubescens]KAF8333751.1 hypothetical protein F5887DRAFT_1080026 [Amanita rubescens]KAF8337279.1 hypothetical protein F5887DRAFT_1078200 [Amanita rubescens]
MTANIILRKRQMHCLDQPVPTNIAIFFNNIKTTIFGVEAFKTITSPGLIHDRIQYRYVSLNSTNDNRAQRPRHIRVFNGKTVGAESSMVPLDSSMSEPFPSKSLSSSNIKFSSDKTFIAPTDFAIFIIDQHAQNIFNSKRTTQIINGIIRTGLGVKCNRPRAFRDRPSIGGQILQDYRVHQQIRLHDLSQRFQYGLHGGKEEFGGNTMTSATFTTPTGLSFASHSPNISTTSGSSISSIASVIRIFLQWRSAHVRIPRFRLDLSELEPEWEPPEHSSSLMAIFGLGQAPRLCSRPPQFQQTGFPRFRDFRPPDPFTGSSARTFTSLAPIPFIHGPRPSASTPRYISRLALAIISCSTCRRQPTSQRVASMHQGGVYYGLQVQPSSKQAVLHPGLTSQFYNAHPGASKLNVATMLIILNESRED